LSQIGSQELERPVVANSYGIEANYRIADNFAIGGWVGYTAARVISLGDADVWNYAVTLAFPDLGKEGNLGGIVIGMQPIAVFNWMRYTICRTHNCAPRVLTLRG
jgi:hypothetical protein